MNSTLFNDKIIVHISERFSEDAGAYDVVYYLQDGKLENVILTSRDTLATPEINATEEQRNLSIELYMAQGLLRHGRGIIGSTVVLQRSRKAPNKVPLLVTSFSEAFFDGQYYQDEKLRVRDASNSYWVSKSCIKEVLRNPLDW